MAHYSMHRIQKLRLTCIAVALSPVAVLAEFRSFDGTLPISSDTIHYSDGYAINPGGYVDISNLVFSTDDEHVQYTRDKTPNQEEGANGDDGLYDDGLYENDDDDVGGAVRYSYLVDGDDIATTSNASLSSSSFIDIILFLEPQSCTTRSLHECDWPSQLGIGFVPSTNIYGSHKYTKWCSEEEGRLIIDPNKFQGKHISLEVPPEGAWSHKIDDANNSMFHFDGEDHRQGVVKYILVMANCNTATGRNLKVSGGYLVHSSLGFLPWNLFGKMHIFSVLTINYIMLFMWYGMRINKSDNEVITPIEKWMLATVGIGLLASLLKSLDLWVWNETGKQSQFFLYTGVVVAAIKAAIIQCLIIMLSKGCCGTMREKVMVAIFGVVYAVVGTTRNVYRAFDDSTNDASVIWRDEETEAELHIILFICSFVFYFWSCCALGRTIKGLNDDIVSQANPRPQKLRRYHGLRVILIVCPVLYIGGTFIFASLWDNFDGFTIMSFWWLTEEIDAVIQENMDVDSIRSFLWVTEAIDAAIFLLVLVSLSCLWAPGADAREYIPVIELTSDQISQGGADEEQVSSGDDIQLAAVPEIT